MTPGGRAQALIDMMTQIIDHPEQPADYIVERYIKQRSFIGSKDRQFLKDTLYSVLRNFYFLKQMLKEATARSLVIQHLRIIQDVPIEVLVHWFDGSPYHPSPLTVLEKLALTQNNTPKNLSKNLVPAWMCAHLAKEYQDNQEFQNALLQPAQVDLRVNPLKGDFESVFKQLVLEGLPVSKMPYSPFGIRLGQRIPPHPLWVSGVLEYQDEGAQLASFLVDARPGQRVLDLCGGAGGKTLALAPGMNNKGQIILSDLYMSRLEKAKERLKRAGIQNTQIHPLDSIPPWGFDRVLVDVPCSGSGTWRRKPELLMRTTPEVLEDLVQTQRAILETAAHYVAKDGWLIYVTCSLFEKENTLQIQHFLSKFPDFSLVPVRTVWEKVLPMCAYPGMHDDFLFLNPLEQGCDGFFISIMEKKRRRTKVAH